MNKIVFAISMMLLMGLKSFALTPTEVLDKCAATISHRNGVTAQFSMESAQYGNAAGTISIKGKKFYMLSNATTMWFDGTTLWTYMASNEEVNISKPTTQQLQTLNPYHFINMYKSGYSTTMTTAASVYNIHLTATDKQLKIKEAFVTVDKSTYAPKEIKMLVGNKWTTFTISRLKNEPVPDSKFSFDANAYPDAEIIDLR
ncbi:MAG: cell envelope biogenesis protein LolA [Prevotella sp.]|nr:cell envelope biogenesis protein LolA [Prevotella sp.]